MAVAVKPGDKYNRSSNNRTVDVLSGSSELFQTVDKRDPLVEYGRAIFDKAMMRAMALIAIREPDTLTLRLQNPDMTVGLPVISNETRTAQLYLASLPSGDNLLHLAVQANDQDIPTGFILTQSADKTVIIHDTNLQSSISPDDEGYQNLIEESRDYIDSYASYLQAPYGGNLVANATESIYAIRQRLGHMSVSTARQTILKDTYRNSAYEKSITSRRGDRAIFNPPHTFRIGTGRK